VKKSASLLALLTLTVLHKISEIIATKVLDVFTSTIKPRLTALEVHHRLVSIEGQKEIARRLESRAEKTKMEVKK
jgi:hypothetical protein